MRMATKIFLIQVHREDGRTDVQELGSDMTAAMRIFKEHERHANGSEVVLLGSESLETLKRTHSSYFGTSAAAKRVMATPGQ